MSSKSGEKKPEGKAFQKLKNQYDATRFQGLLAFSAGGAFLYITL
jgi:hypothetical protein